MDISHFLRQPPTVKLCTSYLENVWNKFNLIASLLQKISFASVPMADRLQATKDAFQEAHRLKGSGGTYGFNEISLFYKQMLIFLRPPFDENRLLSDTELEGAQQLHRTFPDWFAVLKSLFHGLYLQTEPLPDVVCHLLISPTQRALFAKTEFNYLLQSQVVFTMTEWDDLPLMASLPPVTSILVDRSDGETFAKAVSPHLNCKALDHTRFILTHLKPPAEPQTRLCNIDFQNMTLDQLEADSASTLTERLPK